MAKHSTDSSQAAFSFGDSVEHKETWTKADIKAEEPKPKVETKPLIPIPDYELLNTLARIRDGNTKLWGAWYSICQTPEGDIKEARIRKWDEARDRLRVLCTKVRVIYVAMCPYTIEKPNYVCLECTMMPFNNTKCSCWNIEILKEGGPDDNAAISQNVA